MTPSDPEGAPKSRRTRRLARIGGGLVLLLALPFLAHLAVVRLSALTPLPTPEHLGRTPSTSRVEKTDGLILARLVGPPEQLGFDHARLLAAELSHTEGRLFARFEQMLPNPLLRTLLLDLARVRFFDLDRHFAHERLRELSAMAGGLEHDPFAAFIPTYQRFIYLNALYDISLSFEGSPLLGCTTFVMKGSASAGGHVLFARNFDFEIEPTFDQDKTLFVVHEEGLIPFASVAWPGLVGVVTGLNQAGLVAVVHGGRAGEVNRTGEPVIHALRRALSTARDVNGAIEELNRREPMVSHIVIMADAHGKATVLERVPGAIPYRYELGERAAVTNHLLGPHADDPKNQAVLAHSTTLYRKQRGDQLVAGLTVPATTEHLKSLLTERRGINDAPLERGDPRAINADLAAHGVVVDLTARRLFISHAPRLDAGFIELDLDRLFSLDQPLERARIDARP